MCWRPERSGSTRHRHSVGFFKVPGRPRPGNVVSLPTTEPLYGTMEIELTTQAISLDSNSAVQIHCANGMTFLLNPCRNAHADIIIIRIPSACTTMRLSKHRHL